MITEKTFFLKMKKSYEKYKGRAHHRPVSEGFNMKGCHIGGVTDAVEDECRSNKLFALYDTVKIELTTSCAQLACQEKCEVLRLALLEAQLYWEPSFPPICYT